MCPRIRIIRSPRCLGRRLSGPGYKEPFANISVVAYGQMAINWFDAGRDVYIANAVNHAYRESLHPMPPLALPSAVECIVEVLDEDKAGKRVWARSQEHAMNAVAVITDANGRAWFRLPGPGRYTFECDGVTMDYDVPANDESFRRPGFDHITRISLPSASEGRRSP